MNNEMIIILIIFYIFLTLKNIEYKKLYKIY